MKPKQKTKGKNERQRSAINSYHDSSRRILRIRATDRKKRSNFAMRRCASTGSPTPQSETTCKGFEAALKAAFYEGYRDGYHNGADDYGRFEYGGGSRSLEGLKKDREYAWEQSDARESLISREGGNAPQPHEKENQNHPCPEWIEKAVSEFNDKTANGKVCTSDELKAIIRRHYHGIRAMR